MKKIVSSLALALLLSGCTSKPIVRPMPQPIQVEAWEMEQQQNEPNYTQKLLEALQQ